jgi:hypothetical protein
MKKQNVIPVKSPTFFVKRNDPTQISYNPNQDQKDWKFVQVGFGYDFKFKATDFLYIYTREKSGFRGAVITPEHLKIK